MTETLLVGLPGGSYPIHIGKDAWDSIDPHVRTFPCTGCVVVTDEKVHALYGVRFTNLLGEAGLTHSTHIVPDGEPSKSFSRLESLVREMSRVGLDRGSLVFALGGGVVGDLAGLAASIYLRGVRLVQVPTTLVSMVDSSVGGKTGINIPEGKNLVGTFYQPEAVFADTSVLSTLDPRDWYSGLAEAIKIALTLDAGLFSYLETVRDLGPGGDLDIQKVIARACARKAEVVERDEKEEGLRRVLNFGHTLGHGIEAAMEYDGLRHGEAVLLGMLGALNLSVKMSGLDRDQYERALALIRRVPVPDVGIPGDIASYIERDKKVTGKELVAVLIRAIGQHDLVSIEDPALLVEALKKAGE